MSWQSRSWGWGALLRYRDREMTLSGAEEHTTNNRMELLAVISALRALKIPCLVEVTTDSQYVRNGVMTWMAQWKRNGWRSSSRQAVKNRDLWEQLDEEATRHTHIKWHWVKGHSGHVENEFADQLANKAIDKLLKKL